MNMGENSSRLLRQIDVRLEDSLSGLGNPGGPAPKQLDCNPIIPTWDINQGGMLDPQIPPEIALNFRKFTQPVFLSGDLVGISTAYGPIASPAGFDPGVVNVLGSVNENVPTRHQNVLIAGIRVIMGFDVAGATAFNGKRSIAEILIAQADSWATYGQWSGLWRYEIPHDYTTTGIRNPEYATQLQCLVPWDCTAYFYLRCADGTVYPANTTVSVNLHCFARAKNTILPQW